MPGQAAQRLDRASLSGTHSDCRNGPRWPVRRISGLGSRDGEVENAQPMRKLEQVEPPVVASSPMFVTPATNRDDRHVGPGPIRNSGRAYGAGFWPREFQPLLTSESSIAGGESRNSVWALDPQQTPELS
jgi:hypothetical protein